MTQVKESADPQEARSAARTGSAPRAARLFATLRGTEPSTLWIAGLALVIIAGLWAALEAQIARERNQKINDVMRENTNLARAFEEHTARTLGYVNEIVLALQRQYEQKGAKLDIATAYRDLQPNPAVMRNAVITDPGGMIILSSQSAPLVSLADREHIRVHFTENTDRLFIGKPVLARINKQWSIIATRRANHPDGALAGVVSVAIDPAYFSNFYRDLDLGRQGVVALIGADGVVRARLARDDARIGQHLVGEHAFSKLMQESRARGAPGGSVVARSPVDNVERIISTREVTGYPLVVHVGTSLEEALSGVTDRAEVYRASMAATSVGILALAALFASYIRNLRRAQSESATRALRESEMRYRTMIEWSLESILVYRDGKLLYANPAALRALGIGSLQDVIGKPILDFVHPEHHALIRERLALMEGGGGTRSPLVAVKVVRADGALRDMEIQSAAILYDDEPAVHVVGRDITERKRAEEARTSLEAQLREAQKMQAIGTLAGGVAHDFNNILATILGNTGLARQDVMNSNPQALQSLDEIAKAGTRGRDLVQQILSFSRRQPTALKPISLGSVVEEAARLLRATLPARVTLNVHCAAAIPHVLADATQIQQVLINLATNAMQAMRGQPGKIDMRLDSILLDAAHAGANAELRALHERHPGPTLRLEVKDDGCGIDAATMARIFEPFFTTKPVDEGTGLGLSVVHGIIEAHGGAIVVESVPGRGTTFAVYLPASDALTAPDASAAPNSAVPSTPEPGGGKHILYLDDDDALVFLVERLLSRRGYRISGYSDQRAALEALAAAPGDVDLFVTDYNMPGMSGLDVARAVHEIRADLVVAITSGFIDETLRAQAADAGVHELIFKVSAMEEFCESFVRLARCTADDAARANAPAVAVK